MRKLEQMAWQKAISEPSLMRRYPGVEHILSDYYIAGFKAAREMAADLLDHALKWACIEVDQHDRRLLEYQVKRITQLGEDEVR